MRRALLLVFALTYSAFAAPAAKLTSPREHFGFAIGDDYHLANYTQTEAYFKKLAGESDRLRLVDMGRTEEGRTQWMVIASAPENLRQLERYKAIAQRLARAEGVSPDEAAQLAAEGKAVVWIDGGLHASETVGSHQLIETVWHLAASDDPEMRRILRDVIVLCAHANPDGQELVANWYMREPDPTKRVLTATPRLYQKYIGHDNNRDFYFSAMKESTNINRQLYLEWFPQVVYNHHQSGPLGTVIFVPPFRDPFNYNFDPLVVVGVETYGNAIQSRFLQEGKPGATSRSGANYSTWWNGGLRTTTYFHNMIGLLTEIIGNPTPMQIPLVARRQLPSNDLTAPVAPQLWRFRQSIEYSLTANRAILDQASRHREVLLRNIWLMGRNSIARGRTDSWTPRPDRIDAVVRLAANERATGETGGEPDPESFGPPVQRLPAKYWDVLRKPEWRDPRGYIVPADQPDFPTAIKFLNTFVKTGIALHRATADFTVAGKRYPAGSYVVKTDQAFRPHVLDMFEPQMHPNDFKYDGGPPNKPYDVAGYTLALQMGVGFDRVLEAFDGPFERVPYGEVLVPPAGRIAGSGVVAGFLVSPRVNDSVILVNRLLHAGAEVFRLKQPPADAPDFGAGTFFVPDRPGARDHVERAAARLGLTVRTATTAPAADTLVKLAPVRVALWDRFGGSMPSGWTRWLLEQFEFPFEVIYSAQIDAGKLREKYDAIVFVSGAIPGPGVRPPPTARPRNLPPEYEGWVGRITPDKSVPALKEFLQAGGSIVAIGSSTNLAFQLALPLQNALTERSPEGRLRALPDDKFYIPGSVLQARVDATHPLAWGMPERADFYFDRSAAFTLPAGAEAAGVRRVAWFDSDAPLRSGWAWGQSHLKDKVNIASVKVGAGQLHLMGTEIAFRGQTHGTLKLLFNALYLSTARTDRP